MISIAKAEFEREYIEFNTEDVQAVANALITWVKRGTNPYIPPLIFAGMGVPDSMIKDAIDIAIRELGDDTIRKWEEEL